MNDPVKNIQAQLPKALLKNSNNRKIKVAELFAGVGGFRLGLEGFKGRSSTSGYKKRLPSHYKVVFSNQWEPGTKSQIASDIYTKRFGGEGHVCRDIATIPASEIPEHDLLVGGFPCQDYSVANARAGGLEGKKVSFGGRYTG